MATDIKGTTVGSSYTRLFFRGTTSDIGAGTSAEYLATSVESSGTSVDSALSVGTQRVGVGTDSPSQLLHVSGASDPAIIITDTTTPCSLLMISQDTSTSVGTMTSHPLHFITNNVAKMSILSNGLVGIGTSSPAQQLEVLNGGGLQLRLSQSSGSVYTTFAVDSNHDLTITPTSTGQVVFQPTTDSTDFFQVLDADGGTPILNVDSVNEKVGIGKVPTTALDVVGTITGDSYLSISGASSPTITVSDTTTPTTVELGSNNTESWAGTTTNHDFFIKTNGVNKFNFTADGKFGVGIENPESTVDIDGNLTIGANYADTYSAPGNGLLVEGDVGIGAIAPDSQLTVAGGEGGSGVINIWADEGDDNADKCRLTVNTSGVFTLDSKSTGVWVSHLAITGDGSASGSTILDEDDMASDDADRLATQQSIKAYVDNKDETFYMNLAGHQRITASNVWIIGTGDSNQWDDTGGTSFVSIPELSLHQSGLFQANKNTTFVGVTGFIGDTTGAGEDLRISFLLSNAYTSDQTSNITTAVAGTVSQAGALVQDDSYYVSGTFNQAMTAGQVLIPTADLGAGVNKTVSINLTLEFLITG